MRERPIIFNAEMVNAILSGRKTQTRRPVKLPFIDRNIGCELSGNELAGEIAAGNFWNSPFGQPGEQLWVRETFRVHSRATDVATLVYKASERNSWTEQTHRVPVTACDKPVSPDKWTPSIHMPRWASRITLEITGVRVERLNSISDADMRAEGMRWKEEFPYLWESIYGEESWQANSWVWVIEFKRVGVNG